MGSENATTTTRTGCRCKTVVADPALLALAPLLEAISPATPSEFDPFENLDLLTSQTDQTDRRPAGPERTTDDPSCTLHLRWNAPPPTAPP